LVPVYRAALDVKEALRGKPKRLQWPVVSVGSLSAGGAGKTPVVIAIAQMLKVRGWDVDVLSRGYGRSGSGVEMVGMAGEKQIPSGNDNQKNKGNSSRGDGLAMRFGDEPVLIAQRAEVPVWVGADRFAAGARAEASAAIVEQQVLPLRQAQGQDDKFEGIRGVHVLDDGMQHRQLARVVDVVLVTYDDLNDALLPAGNLREPLQALGRADFIAVREEEMDYVVPQLKQFVREGTLIWTVRRKLRFPEPLFVFTAGLRPVAFCAIARPEGFAEMLKEAGCGIVDTIVLRDHHAYQMSDIERIVELAKQVNATGFVTTEKDAVKLTAEMRTRLETLGPVMVAALDAEFVFPERVARELEERVNRNQEKN
jgi:tetraacyldisaccharide 4'-kinase